jgi:glutamine synthetase type III
LTEQQNGGTAAKTAQSTSQTNDLAKLKMYASQHMSASQIAQRLGKSVSAVMQEAAAAGITLDTGSTGSSSSAAKGNPAVGNNVNTTA